MQRRERNLARAYEVEIIGLDAVHVLGRLTEKTGAIHRARQHKRRSNHRDQAVAPRMPHRQTQKRELEFGARTSEIEEPRTRDLRSPLHIDRPKSLPQLQVILRLKPFGREVPRRTHVLEDDEVLLATDR